MKLLIAAKASGNAAASNGWDALMVAAELGIDVDAVKLQLTAVRM